MPPKKSKPAPLISEDYTSSSGDEKSIEIRELLAGLEANLKSHFNDLISKLKTEIVILTSIVSDLKLSLEFSQKEIEDLKVKLSIQEQANNSLHDTVHNLEYDVSMLRDKCTYLENQSRQNNIRIDGIPEETDEMWDQMERKVKEAIEQKLQIQSVSIERAHRIGKQRSDRKLRTIICKLYDWKLKERLLKDMRRKKPDGLFIKEDFDDQTMKTPEKP